MNPKTLIPLLLASALGCRPDTPPSVDTHTTTIVTQLVQTVVDTSKPLAEVTNRLGGFQAQQNEINGYFNEQITNLVNTVVAQASEIASLKQRLTTLEWQNLHSSYSITPESKSFGIYDEEHTKLFISTKNIEPYLDGYKVQLSIGNPAAADFTGLKVISRWGPPWQTNLVFKEWLANWHAVTNDLPQTIRHGSWTDVEISILPATAAEIHQATFDFNFTQVILAAPKP